MTMTFGTGGGGDFKRIPPGSYFAVCDMIALLGMQPGSAAYPKPKLKLYLRWQVPTERTDDDRPMVVGAQLTASMHENASLRALLQGWRGQAFTDEQAAEFDVSKLLGQPCMISVVEDKRGDKTYTNVASVSRLPKGTEPPKPEGELLIYYNRNDKADQEVFKKLPEWLQKKIEDQLEAEPQGVQQAPSPELGEDDIPF